MESDAKFWQLLSILCSVPSVQLVRVFRKIFRNTTLTSSRKGILPLPLRFLTGQCDPVSYLFSRNCVSVLKGFPYYPSFWIVQFVKVELFTTTSPVVLIVVYRNLFPSASNLLLRWLSRRYLGTLRKRSPYNPNLPPITSSFWRFQLKNILW